MTCKLYVYLLLGSRRIIRGSTAIDDRTLLVPTRQLTPLSQFLLDKTDVGIF